MRNAEPGIKNSKLKIQNSKLLPTPTPTPNTGSAFLFLTCTSLPCCSFSSGRAADQGQPNWPVALFAGPIPSWQLGVRSSREVRSQKSEALARYSSLVTPVTSSIGNRQSAIASSSLMVKASGR